MTRLILLLAVCVSSGCEAQDVPRALAATPAGFAPAAEDALALPGPRRVWSRAGSYASPSPDGRLVAFVDWSTGDVAVHDLRTDEDRRITDKGTWTENGSWAEEPLFSPDGSRVAYSYGNVLTGDPFRYELRYVELGDTTQHLLYAVDVRDEWIAALDWSEGAGILVEVNRGDDRHSLATLDPETKALNILETVEGRPHPHDGAFSPDEQHVAYRLGDRAVIRSLAGDEVSSLGVAVNWVLGWARDGSGVLVHTSHDGQAGVWQADVADGRFTGKLDLVRGGIPALRPAGFAGDAYYYLVAVDGPKLHMARIDVEDGKVLTAPVPITSPMDGSASHAAWSRDGSSVAYALRTADREVRLMVRSATGDAVRELTTFDAGRLRGLSWTPNGRYIYVLQDDVDASLLRVDVRTGGVAVVEKVFPASTAVAADDGSIVFARGANPRHALESGLFVYDVATGAERKLAELPAGGNTSTLSVSPDGKEVAVVLGDQETKDSYISIIPLAGGPGREVARLEHPVHFEPGSGGLPWTPDGRYLLAGRGEWDAGEPHELVAVSVEDGSMRKLPFEEYPGPRVYTSLHPDGRQLVFVAGQGRTELWVIDDLRPIED